MRWVRPALTTAVVLALTVAGHPKNRPGLHGQHLLILVAMLVIGVGGLSILYIRLKPAPPVAIRVFVLAVVIAASAVLVWMGPKEFGFVGAFVTASAAAAQLPRLGGATATGVTALAIGVADLIGAHTNVSAVVVTEISLLAFYGLGRYARRLRERTAQAERLVAELRETRAAQAEAAALAERQRIAREMHDVLAHSLSGLLIRLEGARLLARRDAEDAAHTGDADDAGDAGGAAHAGDSALSEAIECAHRLASNGLREARAAIGTLRDEQLPGPELLPDLAARFERDTGVPCRFATVGLPRPLDPRARLTMYRVAQEALTNVARHARPRYVDVRLHHTAAESRLVVEDSGGEAAQGASVHANSDGGGTGRNGYGLTGMRERAELIGGRLTAGPTATGFRVDLRIPA